MSEPYLDALLEQEQLYADARAEEARQYQRLQMIQARESGKREGRIAAEKVFNSVHASEMREAIRFGMAKMIRAWEPKANNAVMNFAREVAQNAEKVTLRVPALHDPWSEEIDAREKVVTLEATIPEYHVRWSVVSTGRF